MYSINNIPFANFGISPGRDEASNIAVSGHLDMPERIGKIYHDWTGEAGIEPYVLASEIRHGGRSVNFSGLMQGNDKAATYGMLETFYRELDSFKDLVPLVTPWGSHSVFIQEEVKTTFLQDGWLKVDLTFEEPVVPIVGILPEGSEVSRPHIDGVALSNLGMFLSGFKDHLNRPKVKEQNFTSYQNQGYQITPPEALEFELNLIAFAASYAELKEKVQSLHKLLSMPGMRKLKVDQLTRDVFNARGFQVSNIKVASNLAICRINLPLMTSTTAAPLDLGYLLDNNYNNIVSNLEELIKVN